MKTHNIHFQNKIKALKLYQINILIFAVMEKKNLGTQNRVRNSRGKRAIGVRAIEVLLYIEN